MRMYVLPVLSILLCTGAAAQTPAKPASTVPVISISAAETDVRDVVRSVAAQSGARILIGTEVTGKLTMKLDKVSVDTGLRVITQTTGLRYSRLTMPVDKADKVTPDQAASLVSAADAITASGVLGIGSGSAFVNVAAATGSPAGTTTVYLVHTKTDPAAIKAAREEARKKTADVLASEQEAALSKKMSPDARDPGIVKAYSALQSLRPDQVATLTREFILNSTPEQRNQIGEAFKLQREEFMKLRPQQ